MKKQAYILKNQDSFILEHIFECGQCFRWKRELDGSYTGVVKNGVINVKKEASDVVFQRRVRAAT